MSAAREDILANHQVVQKMKVTSNNVVQRTVSVLLRKTAILL